MTRKLAYWADKAGTAGILLGPAESILRLMSAGNYLGPEQVDEGIGIMTAGLAAWNAAKYLREHEEGRSRSPLVHLGRAAEVAGPAVTEYNLQMGNAENVFRTFGPAALGITLGAFLEYVAGPVHEMFSKKYKGEQHEA
jgi:hypothetical protein